MQVIDYENLRAIATKRHEDFLEAKPFAHIVLDDFLLPEAAEALLSEFSDSEKWSLFAIPTCGNALIGPSNFIKSNAKPGISKRKRGSPRLRRLSNCRNRSRLNRHLFHQKPVF